MDADIASALAAIGESTARLPGTVAGLTDEAAAAPSRLPGWSRGHVLTHLARNADGLRNLLAWARTGTETPMYPSEAARDAAIAAGAGRTAAELGADVRASAARLAGDAARLAGPAWAAPVSRRGQRFPARQVLAMRRSEVEIHHVDLDAGYLPGDWPGGFARAGLARVARDLAGRPDVPDVLISPEGGPEFRIGPAAPPGGAAGGPGAPPGAAGIAPGGRPVAGIAVAGAPGALLAWLTGRGDGTGLRVTGAAGPPVLPAWR